MSFVEIDFQDLEFYETLGRGSAGSVYRGLWRSREQIVALKKLNLLEDEVRNGLCETLKVPLFCSPGLEIPSKPLGCNSLYRWFEVYSLLL